MISRKAVLLVLSLFLFGLARPAVPAAGLASKVDARVWEDTSGTQTAHFLVILRNQAKAQQAAAGAHSQDEQVRGVVSALNITARSSQVPVIAEVKKWNAPFRSFVVVNALAVEGGRGLVQALAARSDVAAIEADRAFRVPLEMPEPPVVSMPVAQAPSTPEWGITKTGASLVWADGYRGEGIVYANADTGVQWDHPALKGQYRGWNSTDSTVNHNYNWWDAIHASIGGSSCGINLTVPCDDYGHGTHTTGTGVGETADQSNQIGMAPGAKWIACRNMDAGVGRPSTYIECLDFFIQPWDLNHQNPDPSKHADVISNSYTCPSSELCVSTSLHTAVENVRAAGIFMSVSAGNSGSACGTIYDTPSTETGVFTVGATNSGDTIAAFSSRGPVGSLIKPQISAPGVTIRSAYPGSSYTAMSGTSMAAPHVAGAVALLWSAFPQLRGSVAATEALLEQSAVKLYSSTQLCGIDTTTSLPNNVYGYGRLAVKAAYDLFASGWPLAPVISGISGSLPVLNTIQLGWTDPNVSTTAYSIERSDDGAAWAVLATLPGTQQTFTDTVPDARTYYYRVYAAQGTFLSASSSPAAWRLFWLPLIFD